MKRKSRTVALPEKEVVKTILNFFEPDTNVTVWRRNVGAGKMKSGKFIRFGNAGQSDLFGIISKMTCPICGKVTRTGVHLEIEVKAINGKLSPAQKEFLAIIRKNGGVAITARPLPDSFDPTGLNNLRNVLRKIDKEVCPDCQDGEEV